MGAIPEAMAEGIEEHGSYVEYKANVKVCWLSIINVLHL